MKSKPRIRNLNSNFSANNPYRFTFPWAVSFGTRTHLFMTFEEAKEGLALLLSEEAAPTPPSAPPGYMKMAEKLDRYRGDITGADSSHPVRLNLETADKLEDANLVSSKVRDSEDRHILALDIDFPAMLVPSSTPGHHHLYIDKEMSWPQLELVLQTLSYAGIIEEGYAAASIERHQTNLRTPWERK
ncbi:hypothetical protein [Nocardia sp. NPDC057440]|uniref:hypothetical protein n=1 Tax=Nocardia sp. NPDC057440 TaxID=3346134 RepID=UPI00367301F6